MVEPVIISTLSDMISGGYTMRAHCHACSRSAVLDLPALAERLGPDAVVDGYSRYRCTGCGSRDVGVTLSPRTGAPAVGVGWVMPAG